MLVNKGYPHNGIWLSNKKVLTAGNQRHKYQTHKYQMHFAKKKQPYRKDYIPYDFIIWNSKNFSIQKEVSGCLGYGGEGGRGWPQRGKQKGDGNIQIWPRWWLHDCVHLPKLISLYALSGWILLHEKYASIKLFYIKTWRRGHSVQSAGAYSDLEDSVSKKRYWQMERGSCLPISVLWLPNNPGSTNITSCCSSGELAKVENLPWFLG